MSIATRLHTDARLIAALVVIAALACGERAQAQTAPAAPGALQVSARAESSLSLRWKDRSQSETYYKVRVSGRVRRLAANRQAVTVTGLRPGVTYRVAVQACTRGGRCSKAATAMAKTAGARRAPEPSTSPTSPTTTEPTLTPPVPTPPSTPTVTVDLTGTVTVTTGNCMPSIGGNRDSCNVSPAVGARVLLYGPVLKSHVDLPGSIYDGPRPPSAETTTDAAGRYHLVVGPGTYSFLVDAGAGPECTMSDADWSACPYTLLAPTRTVDLNVDHAVW
jgi:hypothetical protein